MRIWIFVALLCLSIGPMAGQNPTATLVGVIQDSSGAILPGAQIELRNTDIGALRKASSDFKGEFTIPNLVPGPLRSRHH